MRLSCVYRAFIVRLIAPLRNVFDAIPFFGLLGIIEAVGGADEITGDPADTLKLDAFSYSLRVGHRCSSGTQR